MGTLLPRLTEALSLFSLAGTGQVVVAMDDQDDTGRVALCFRAEDGHFPDPDWFQTISAWDWPVRGIRVVDREMRERYQWGETRYIPLATARTDDIVRATVGLPIEDSPQVLQEVQNTLNDWLDDHDLSGARVLELFAGVGIHTALLHPRAAFVDAVTTPARAIDDLHANFNAIPKDSVRRTYASMARGLSRTYCKPGSYEMICAWVPRRGAVGLWRTIDQIQASTWITTHADVLNAGPDFKRILSYGYRPKRIKLVPCEPHRLRTQAVLEWTRAQEGG
jgi:hypothetical protein